MCLLTHYSMEFPLYNSRISVYSLTDYIHSPSLPFLLILSHQVDGHFNQCHCNVSQFTSFEYKRYQAGRTAPELGCRDSRRTVGFALCWLGPVWLMLRESYSTEVLHYSMYGKGDHLVATSSGNTFYSSGYSIKMEKMQVLDAGNKHQYLYNSTSYQAPFSLFVSAHFYV